MSVVIVVGAQWGDEGKGKVVDFFTERADVVVRYGGGANAGHTLVIDGKKLVTHLVPSGVCHPGKSCVLGDGMVIDPHTLLEELGACQARGLLAKGELLVGDGAHVILPYHKLVDGLREDRGAKVGKAIGTTAMNRIQTARLVGQAGLDYMFNDRWGVNVDVKYVMMEPNAHVWAVANTTPLSVGSPCGAGLAGVGVNCGPVFVPLNLAVKINPVIISGGLTYRFGADWGVPKLF